MKRWILWAIVYFPALCWAGLSLKESLWWVENIVAFPALFMFGYVLLALVLGLARCYGQTLVCLVLAGAFALMTPKGSQALVADCDTPVTVLQYNLYYENPDIHQFINYLLTQPADLIVMQEVAPEIGEQLKLLDDRYPFFYGGQEGIGYPSSQMILSTTPLTDASVFHTPDQQSVIRAVWHPPKQDPITLMVAHPPSPRSKELWHRRNALIRTIESLNEQYPDDEVLIVGDFNLSSISRRFAQLFPTFQTAPVASWPNWGAQVATPALTMIAIDHLWLQSANAGRRLCHRESLSTPNGSDHKLVLTKIGY
ncbi:endonuclease/exonuclease/phosphatase family protein [Vibrio cholerae]